MFFQKSWCPPTAQNNSLQNITEVISKSPWELHFEKSENNFPPGFYFIAFLVLRHLLVETKEILNQSHNFY